MQMLLKHFAWFVLSVTIAAASAAHSEVAEGKADPSLLPAVALLFHGPYGEHSYELTGTADGSVTLQEFDSGRIRLNIRRLSGKPCAFVATHSTISGLDVEQLDFTKFDGTYQAWNACSQFGPPSEQNCTYSLHFNSQVGGYCQNIFRNPPSDVDRVSFPDGSCRPFGLGSREKKFYAKYIEAFEHVYNKCGGTK